MIFYSKGGKKKDGKEKHGITNGDRGCDATGSGCRCHFCVLHSDYNKWWKLRKQ